MPLPSVEFSDARPCLGIKLLSLIVQHTGFRCEICVQLHGFWSSLIQIRVSWELPIRPIMPINAYLTYPAFDFRRHAGRLYCNISSYPNQPEPIYTNHALPSQTQALSNKPFQHISLPTPARAYLHQPSSTKSNPGNLKPT